ncbi:hypothetical protein HHK36_019388 [Tetracentron sinense]|uniref:RRM domain-containing protein n=1 Tax=Tetracentron sinense TaxID=13715 RepID=A0A834YW63_TETSI|nr:hypothetical protein HHK36_019388 [Tetracentron sinense]
MSLFLGNLSSHIRRDELEPVFQRFGQSTVQLKDRYGFVIYKSVRRFTSARFYESRRGRNFARGDYAMRKMDFHDRREYKMSTKQPDSDGGRPNMADMLDKETSYHHDDIEDQIGEKRISFRSRSRSVSSRMRSLFSSSRSTSTSSYLRSESYRTRSRSPTSLSLSISPGAPLSSSPNKLHMKVTGTSLKGSFDSVTSPMSKNLLVEGKQLVEDDASSEKSKLKNTSAATKDENTLSSFKVDADVNKDHPEQWDDDGNHTSSRIAYKTKHPSTTPSDKDAFPGRSSSPDISRERRDLQKTGTLELYMVLKHYGQAPPEDNEKHRPIESYFGSAHLWPWENYARRIAQNRGFRIGDKYEQVMLFNENSLLKVGVWNGSALNFHMLVMW